MQLMVFFDRDSWMQLGNMSREEAMRSYVDAITALSPNWRNEGLFLFLSFLIKRVVMISCSGLFVCLFVCLVS
jgi:hypothetical protein